MVYLTSDSISAGFPISAVRLTVRLPPVTARRLQSQSCLIKPLRLLFPRAGQPAGRIIAFAALFAAAATWRYLSQPKSSFGDYYCTASTRREGAWPSKFGTADSFLASTCSSGSGSIDRERRLASLAIWATMAHDSARTLCSMNRVLLAAPIRDNVHCTHCICFSADACKKGIGAHGYQCYLYF
jgi:hypothetical protein